MSGWLSIGVLLCTTINPLDAKVARLRPLDGEGIRLAVARCVPGDQAEAGDARHAEAYRRGREIAAALRAEGIDAQTYSQRDRIFSVDLGELSIVRLLVPVWEYERALQVIREHLNPRVRIGGVLMTRLPSAAPPMIKAPRMTLAPRMPQHSTRCCSAFGTAKKVRITEKTKTLSTESAFSST
mgnify:CR=1 FL=1